MSIVCTVEPSIEPVSLEEARLQCRLGNDTSEDALLAIYIKAARRGAELRTHRALITQTWVQRLDEFPCAAIKLMKPPIQAVPSLSYVDIEGADQVLTAPAYVLDAALLPGYLLPAMGTQWPATSSVINAVTITLTAGFGVAATDVPADIRTWILLTVGYLYGQREAFDAVGRVREIPNRFVDSLLDEHIVYGL